MNFLARMFWAVAVAAMLPNRAVANPDKVGVVVQYLALSPSGQELAFSADFDGQARIWVVGTDGTRLRRVSSLDLNSPRVDSRPTWSPDARNIAYERSDGDTTDIWVMQADGAHPTKLTSNGANNTDPVWSPDGRTIAFVSSKNGNKDIWLMNADGTGQRKVYTSNLYANSPSFSPDGKQLVFSRTDGETASLAIVNVDGSGLRALTGGKFRDWEPNWGLRGIVFCSDRNAPAGCKLWIVQPDGSNLRAVGQFEGHDPVWLPDGNIAYADDDMRYSKALSSISIANVSIGTKRVLIDIQGYLTPIDIRPGSTFNQVNPHSNGRIQVAILSTRNFDAPKLVDRKSLTFGRTGAENSLSSCARHAVDVNGDGIPDLVCRFDLRMTGFRAGDNIGVLRFNDSNGKPFEGRDSITTVLTDDPADFKD
jgi:TolB protein